MVSKTSLFGLILFSAAGALAVLPPDALLREPEIRARRIKTRKEYEQRLEERRALITREYEKATKAIDLPPWELDRLLNEKPEKQVQAKVQNEQIVKQGAKKQILVSIMLLIIIGSIVGWVKYNTREIEL